MKIYQEGSRSREGNGRRSTLQVWE